MTRYFKFQAKKADVRRLIKVDDRYLKENVSCFLLNDTVAYFISSDKDSIDLINDIFNPKELFDFYYDPKDFRGYECIGNGNILP